MSEGLHFDRDGEGQLYVDAANCRVTFKHYEEWGDYLRIVAYNSQNKPHQYGPEFPANNVTDVAEVVTAIWMAFAGGKDEVNQ